MISQQIGKGKPCMDAKNETYIEVAKTVPAVTGVIISGFTLNEIVALVTIFYVLIQAGFLVYKWYWDWKEKKQETIKQ